MTLFATSAVSGDARVNYEESAGSTYKDIDVKDGDQIVVLYWAKVNAKAAVWGGEQDLSNTVGENAPGFLTGEDKTKAEVSVSVNEPTDAPNTATAVEDMKKQYANGNGRNDNYTVLTYGAKGYTEWDEAHVTTYGFDVTKTEKEDTRNVGTGNYALLDGAEFSVRKTITRAELTKLEDAAVAALTGTPTDTEKENERKKVRDQYEECNVQTSASVGGASLSPTLYYKKADEAKLRFQDVGIAKDDGTTNDDKVATEPNAMALSATTYYVDTHVFYRYLGDNAFGGSAGTDTIKPTGDRSAHLYGLEAGTYVLIEEKAPTGYNKLAHPVIVTITGDDDSDGLINGQTGYDKKGDGTIDATSTDVEYDSDEGQIAAAFHTNDNVFKAEDTGYNKSGADWKSTVTPKNSTIPAFYDLVDATNNKNGGVQVINQTGAELPSTGGIGTTIFYVAGTVLVVGAVVMLVAKRRMGSEA